MFMAKLCVYLYLCKYGYEIRYLNGASTFQLVDEFNQFQMHPLILFFYIVPLVQSQRKAFVDPQSDCRIHCLNGGFCAYLVDNPTVHTCLCLLDLFHGDRCQYSGFLEIFSLI